MNRIPMGMIVVLAAAVTVAGGARPAAATPSSSVWTNCAFDIQSYGVWHVTYDNYTTLGEKGPARGGQAFPNDLGLTVGVLPFQRVQLEIGIDWFEPSDYPAFFNAKIGCPEGVLFPGAPALQAGIFNAGTKDGVTSQNVLHVITGRSLPNGAGRVHVSAYVGNQDLLRSSSGEKQNTGLMAAYDLSFRKTGPADAPFNRHVISADYASGENALGGYAIGLYTYFSPNVDLLVGPVWFNDEGENGSWKLTTQLDVNF